MPGTEIIIMFIIQNIQILAQKIQYGRDYISESDHSDSNQVNCLIFYIKYLLKTIYFTG